MIFGVPETDDVGISFWCPLQKGEINVFLPVSDQSLTNGATLPMTLSAGAMAVTVEAKVDANAEAGNPSVEGKLAADSPFLSALIELDRFQLTVKDTTTIFPTTDADLKQLLELCRAP